MDISNLAPEIAKLLGVQPSTLVLLIMVIGTIANAAARLIPQDATGPLAVVRKIAAVIGVYVPSRVTSGVSVTDVAQAALGAPPIPQNLELQSGHVKIYGDLSVDGGVNTSPISPDSRARTGNTRLVDASALMGTASSDAQTREQPDTTHLSARLTLSNGNIPYSIMVPIIFAVGEPSTNSLSGPDGAIAKIEIFGWQGEQPQPVAPSDELVLGRPIPSKKSAAPDIPGDALRDPRHETGALGSQGVTGPKGVL